MQRVVSRAHTLPASFYICPQHFRRELETVFRNNWLHVGRVDQVTAVGDYFSGTIHRQPYIVTRSDGGIRAFDNVCRHHGTLLTKAGTGHLEKKCISCPYHGWTYSLDGRLIRATKLKGIEDFKAKDYGLHSVPLKVLGEQLIFINFNGEKPGQEEKFVALENDYAKLRHVRQKVYEMKCNWKVFVDNFLDGGYHVEYAHKGLEKILDMKTYHTTTFERHSVQTAGIPKAKTGDGQVAEDAGKTRYTAMPPEYYFVYPNVMLNRYGVWLETNTVFPVDTERCTVVFDWYVEKDAKIDDQTIDHDIGESDQVQQEDDDLCTQIQAGMHSQFFHQGRYAPNVENGMYHFHDLLLKELDMTVPNC